MREFTWPVRVYYEDTDAGGVVYHSNYLNYMERARTEMLRHIGYEQTDLIEQQQLIFAVKHVDIDFRKPARFNDRINVVTRIIECNSASFRFEQIIRDAKDDVLCSGKVLIVALDSYTFKPKRLPEFLAVEMQDVN
jgi:acyl-CoA thioester hydrolase